MPLKEVLLLTVPKRRRRAMHCHALPHRATWEAPGSVRRRKEEEVSMARGLYSGFCRKEWVR